MKLSTTILMVFVAASVFAKDKVVQPGIPSVLEAANGKKAKVFLQRMEDGNIIFQPFKSPKDVTVPADKISSLKFFPKYDAEGVKASFNGGDYAGVLTTLEALFSDFEQYMAISNNMQEAFCMMLDAYQAQGNQSRVMECATILEKNIQPELVRKAQASMALVAIAQGDYDKADAIAKELDSDAGRLYIKAASDRAKGDARAAFDSTIEIIASHANDLEWLPQCELLNAHLYLDLAITNSAVITARQVKNIYGGTNIAADAEKLFTQLGGEEKAPQAEEDVPQE